MAELVPTPRSDQPRGLPLRAALGGLKRGFEALGVRNYRLYWTGQVVSLIGTWMQQVSLPWLVLSLGGSPLQLGFVAVLQFGPAMLLAPFGGVFADRIEKRHALIATQVAAAGQAFTIFLICATGIVEIWMVLAMAGVLGLINAVDMPVRQSLPADLVPRNLLANAIALNSMAFNSARVIGPALAGVIIAIGTGITGSAVAGVAINLGINTLTYSGVLVGLLRMDPRQIRRHEQPERHPSVLHSLREGVSYAYRTPLVLWCLVLLGGIAAFGFNFQILLPLFSRQVLGLSAEGYGALYAAMGIGAMAGSLTLAIMRSRRAIPLMLVGGLLFAAMLVGIAAARNVAIAAGLILGAGFFSMLMINTINATVQANVPDALRGRVMSFYVTVFAGSAPLGGLFAGAVAQAWGTPAAFLAGAALSLVTLGAVALGFRAAGREGRLGITTIDGAAARPGEPGTDGAREARRAPSAAP
jgi:MFS family permease